MERPPEDPAPQTPFSNTQQTLERILEEHINPSADRVSIPARIARNAGPFAQIIGGLGFGAYSIATGIGAILDPHVDETLRAIQHEAAAFLIGMGVTSTLIGAHSLIERLKPTPTSIPFETSRLIERYDAAIPTIRENLPRNPNAHLIYALAHTHLERGTRLEDVIGMLEKLSTAHDETLGPTISAMARQPERYADAWTIEDTLQQYHHAHTLHPLIATTIRLRRPDLEDVELLGVDELFPTLLGMGWKPYQILMHLEELMIPRTNAEAFFDAYTRFDREVVQSAVRFYDSPSTRRFLSDDQRLAIAKRLFEHGNRGYARGFRAISIDDETIGSYIASLNAIPSIGTKGQMRALLAANTALSKTPLALRAIHEALEPTTPVHTDEPSARALEAFLERHPTIDRQAALNAFEEYSRYTDGAAYTNAIIEDDAALATNGERIKERTARKIIGMIKHKTDIARYERFEATIKNIQVNTLESFIGTTIPEEQLELATSESMTNILVGATNYLDSSGIDRTTFIDLLHVSITEPERAEPYILSLEGNRKLDTTLEQRIGPWRTGLRKRYLVVESALDPEALEDHYEALISIAQEPSNTTDVLMHARAMYERISESGDRRLISEARRHLEAIERITHGPTITFEDSKHPIDTMQMGVVTGSCTNITRSKHGFDASVANTIDANKKVIYHTNSDTEKVGRTLAVLTDAGIITHEAYNNTHFDIGSGWTDYFVTYAGQVGVPLIVPATFAGHRIRSELESKGAKHVPKLEATLHHAVSEGWYSDRGLARRDEDGSYRFENLEAFVIEPRSKPSDD